MKRHIAGTAACILAAFFMVIMPSSVGGSFAAEEEGESGGAKGVVIYRNVIFPGNATLKSHADEESGDLQYRIKTNRKRHRPTPKLSGYNINFEDIIY